MSKSNIEDLEREIEEMEKAMGLTPEVEEPEETEEVEEVVEEETPEVEEEVLEVSTEDSQEEVEDEPEDREERSWKKRHADLRRHQQEREAALKKEIEELKSKTPDIAMPSTPEEIAEWAKTNPKAAAIVKAIAKEQAAEEAGALSKEMESLKRMKEEIETSKAEALVLKAHPDFKEITKSDEFHDWVESKTARFQDMIYEGTPEEIIEGVTLYKNSLKKDVDSSKDDAKVAVRRGKSAPATETKGKSFSESQVEKMSASEYEKNEEAIARSMREGTFTYDISGRG